MKLELWRQFEFHKWKHEIRVVETFEDQSENMKIRVVEALEDQSEKHE